MLSGVGNAVSNRMMRLPDRRAEGGFASFADLMPITGDRSPAGAPASSSTPRTNSITYAAIETNFDAWARERRADGAGEDFLARVDAAKATYLDVARKAERSGGFGNAKDFVRTLGTEELQALQQTHSLADPIDPSTLMEEGALNLLLPRNMARDIDGNGSMSVGKAETIVFPAGDAPQAVKDAWAKTTEGMDFATKLHLQMSMHLAANGEREASGGIIGSVDYAALVDRAIAGADFSLRFQRADQKAFATQILDGLRMLRTNLSPDAP